MLKLLLIRSKINKKRPVLAHLKHLQEEERLLRVPRVPALGQRDLRPDGGRVHQPRRRHQRQEEAARGVAQRSQTCSAE